MANITKPTGLSTIWAAGGTKINPGTSKVNIGWVVQLPPYEYQNWIDNRQDQAIAHFSQHGVPEWDSTTEYQGLLSYTQGSDGIIYKCITTNTNKDPINPLNSLYWAQAFETFGSVQVVSDALATHINNYQTLSAIGNVSAARTNLSVYSKSESDARFASLNGNSSQVFSVAIATQPEHAVRLGQVSGLLTQATESALGVVKLATTSATESGTDDLTAITPLKASNVYLKKSGNLAGLANYATARSNLGLGTAATQNSEAFLQPSRNLSDVQSATTARNNLGLTTTATQPEAYFLRSGQNLADVASASAARTNLGLTSTATTPISSLMLKADNLAGLANIAQARNNLGLGNAALLDQSVLMYRSNNLADLTNAQTARNNLGLGNAATKNIYGISGDIDLSASLSGTGYKSLGDGLKMVWGTFNLPIGGGVRQYVAFPIQFTSFVAFRGTGVDDSAEQMIGTVDVSLTGMSIKKGVADNYARSGTWFAIGV